MNISKLVSLCVKKKQKKKKGRMAGGRLGRRKGEGEISFAEKMEEEEVRGEFIQE